MQTKQFNELEAARRAYTFLTSTPPAPPLATMHRTFTQQVQVLGTTIDHASAQASAQTAATGTITDKVAATHEAAKDLRTSHLAPLKEIAKILIQGSAGSILSPNFPDSITVPSPRHPAALLSASSAAAQLITPHQDLFIARGLPDDFLDQLAAQATVLSQSMQARGTAKVTRVSTTTDLKQLFRELRGILRILEISVTKACKADRLNGPATMTAWKNARTIRKIATLADIPFTSPAPTLTPATPS